MKKVTLTNSFHNTKAVVCVHPSVTNLSQDEIYLWLQAQTLGTWKYVERQKLKRVWQKLCGIKDCKCGVVR